jgi:N-acyl-D-aspartate/D-glutamate deacylase
MYDLLIKNGTLIDGTGRPMVRGDVAVKEDRIEAIGDLSGAMAERIIDAAGHYVAPGFIDVNNHSDTYWQLLANPELESMLRQGVTTVIGGNSGSSLAPLTDPSVIRSIQKWTDVGKINFNWLSMKEFLAEIDRRGLTLNFATLVGHGTIRRGAMKDETRPIAPREIALMEDLLERALKEGAIGLSTGLIYTHARGAGSREIATLVRKVVEHGGVYATYVRDEGAGLPKAVEEAIAIAKETDVMLHISHLKAVGRENWPLMEEAFTLIDTAVTSGLRVSFDVYPYTATGSVMYTLLPPWITESGRKMMLHRLRDVQVRQAVIRDMKKERRDYSQVLIAVSQLNKMLTRRKVSDISVLQGKAPEEVILDVLLASDGRAIVSLEVLSEKNIEKAVQHPSSVISSNGTGYNLTHKLTGDIVHPRSFGTFPKVFARYVRGRKLLSWEEAVHKMTGKPAAAFGLAERGLLKEGYFADIVVIQPDEIEDRATMEEPYRYPDGIPYVIVNGETILDQGQLTGKRPGVILKRVRKWLPW